MVINTINDDLRTRVTQLLADRWHHYGAETGRQLWVSPALVAQLGAVFHPSLTIVGGIMTDYGDVAVVGDSLATPNQIILRVMRLPSVDAGETTVDVNQPQPYPSIIADLDDLRVLITTTVKEDVQAALREQREADRDAIEAQGIAEMEAWTAAARRNGTLRPISAEQKAPRQYCEATQTVFALIEEAWRRSGPAHMPRVLIVGKTAYRQLFLDLKLRADATQFECDFGVMAVRVDSERPESFVCLSFDGHAPTAYDEHRTIKEP